MPTRRELLQLMVAPAVLPSPAARAWTASPPQETGPRWFVDHDGWIIPAGDRDALRASLGRPVAVRPVEARTSSGR